MQGMATLVHPVIDTPIQREALWRQSCARPVIRVLTVDENSLVRAGLSAIVNKDAGMQVVAEARSGEEALERLRDIRPDVMTIDLQLPDMTGEHLVRCATREFPALRVVLIAGRAGDIDFMRMLEAGAIGIVLKDAQDADVVDTIRQVHLGRRVIPRKVASSLAEQLGEETLTAREAEVLRVVALGYRNKEIAAQLSIADETVRMHMKNILSKLAANNRTHAVSIAVSRGMLTL